MCTFVLPVSDSDRKMRLESSLSSFSVPNLIFSVCTFKRAVFPNPGRKRTEFPDVFLTTFSHLVVGSKAKLKCCIFLSQSGYFKVSNLGEMAFAHLDVVCFYTLLICAAFSCVSSNAEIKGKATME